MDISQLNHLKIKSGFCLIVISQEIGLYASPEGYYYHPQASHQYRAGGMLASCYIP